MFFAFEKQLLLYSKKNLDIKSTFYKIIKSSQRIIKNTTKYLK